MNRLPTHAALSDFYAQHGQGNGVFYMGHASILGVFNGKKILFDPVILSQPYCDSWAFFPPQVSDQRVFDVDAVVVSHIHQDHYDVEYLKALNGRAKIIILGGRPSFEADLREHQVQNVHIIPPETVTEIFEGVYYFGVAHETNGIDSSAIVFNHDFCVYHGNDNYLTAPSMQKFTAIRPNIDVACIPYAYIHWYPFLMDYSDEAPGAKQIEGDRLVAHYMQDCIESTKILSPQVMIPFGANLLLDDGNCYSDINLAVKTPLEFCDYVASTAPELGSVVKPLLAGDYCGLSANGELTTVIHHPYTAPEYRAAANEFLAGRPQKQNHRDWCVIDTAAFVTTLEEKLQHIEGSIDPVIRLELDYLNEPLKLEVDCNQRKARFVKEFSPADRYYLYTLDPIASGEWLNGKRFEEILGMRRFTLKRVPNLYQPDVLRMMTTVF